MLCYYLLYIKFLSFKADILKKLYHSYTVLERNFDIYYY